MKVGIVGVGTMGTPIAEAVVNAGHELYAHDIDQAAADRAESLGAQVMPNARSVADSATVTLMSLPMPADVADVVLTPETGLLAGAKQSDVIADLSTVDPVSTQRNAARAAELGVGYLDCPVLGRPQSIGKWTLPTGGTEEAVATAEPVLEAIAGRIIHVGPSGWGNIIKLLNNMMFGVINAVTVEIMALCAKVGMDPAILHETIASSGAASVSNLFVELGPKILARDFDPTFSLDLLHKDMKLGIGMAADQGVPVVISAAAQLLNETGRAKGLGAEDTCTVIKIFEDLYKVEVKPAS